MVSHAVYEPHPAGVYGVASRGLEEVLSTLWLRGVVRVPLDTVLRQHQSLECLYRRRLFLAYRLLYGCV